MAGKALEFQVFDTRTHVIGCGVALSSLAVTLLRKFVVALFWVVLAQGLAGCATSLPEVVKPYAGAAPKLQTVYVIAGGWHTEIGVPVAALSKPLASLPDVSPDSRYVVFGWGQRDYYMARNPGIGDLLAAAVSGPSVVLVIPLRESPTEYFASNATVFAIPVSQAGLDRLAQFVWASIEKDRQDLPRRLADGPDPGSAFYASGLTYSLANTCNAWTAEALGVSGLPVSASGVVFAHGVTDQVRGVAVEGR
jgi:uncharacterized protein (TIGR02117 family)